jgi:hypothetical protein
MIRRFILSLFLAIMCVAAPLPAAAFSPFSAACTSNTNSSTVCKTENDNDPNSITVSGPQQLMLKITNVVAFMAGAIAVVMIMAAAIRFITAGSDVSTGSRTDTDVEDARRSIANAMLGLAAIALARFLIQFAIQKL